MALEANTGITSEDVERFRDKAVAEDHTWNIDWENGRIGGTLDGIDAVRQYIYKTLKTEANRYLIYDTTVGTGIRAMVHENRVSRAYMEGDIPRMVRKALNDSRILNVHDFVFFWPEDEGDALNISFTADTIYGVLEGVEMDV
jgi:hypothetical protein